MNTSFWVRSSLAMLLLLGIGITTPLVYPKPLFAHKVEDGKLTVFSDQEIPEAEGELFLERVSSLLDASPLHFSDTELSIYVSNSSWRRAWLWVVPSGAVGGFVVPPLTRNHTFLSGADFATNELIAPSDYRPHPPRTLAYYGAHELTHVIMYQKVGLIRFYRMPRWVVEGFADYVALPRESAAVLYGKIGEHEADLDMMKTHGVYAPYRLLVTYFLEDAGWLMEELLQTDLTAEEAQHIAFAHLR